MLENMETVRINFDWSTLKEMNLQNNENLNSLWDKLINIDIDKYTEEILNIKGMRHHKIQISGKAY